MENNNKNDNKNQQPKYEGKAYAYIAIGLAVAGAVAFGVSFTKLGIYALIASMIFEIAAITFVNLQDRKNKLKWDLYIKIAAYVIFAAALLVFIGGTVWSAEK